MTTRAHDAWSSSELVVQIRAAGERTLPSAFLDAICARFLEMRVCGAEISDVLSDEATFEDCMPPGTNGLNKKRVRAILQALVQSAPPTPTPTPTSTSNQSPPPPAASSNEPTAPAESTSITCTPVKKKKFSSTNDTVDVAATMPPPATEAGLSLQSPILSSQSVGNDDGCRVPSFELELGRTCLRQGRHAVALLHFERAAACVDAHRRSECVDEVQSDQTAAALADSERVAAANACGELSFCLQLRVGVDCEDSGDGGAFTSDRSAADATLCALGALLRSSTASPSAVTSDSDINAGYVAAHAMQRRAFELAQRGCIAVNNGGCDGTGDVRGTVVARTAAAALARCYRDGIGCAVNREIALSLATAAAALEPATTDNAATSPALPLPSSGHTETECAWACVVLAGCLDNDNDVCTRVHLLERAAAAGNAPAAVNLAMAIEGEAVAGADASLGGGNGDSVAATVAARVLELYRQAAAAGSTAGMTSAALELTSANSAAGGDAKGAASAADALDEATAWWARAAALGDARAATCLAAHCESKAAEMMALQAETKATIRVSRGAVSSTLAPAATSCRGLDHASLRVRAMRYWARACELYVRRARDGERVAAARAFAHLARYLLAEFEIGGGSTGGGGGSGAGAATAATVVSAVLRHAAELGDVDACARLGASLGSDGAVSGGVRDAHEACMWLQRAATAGHADAACNLAHLLANGAAIGGRDDARAAAWYTRAAESGHTRAMLGLAHLIESGRHAAGGAASMAPATSLAAAADASNASSQGRAAALWWVRRAAAAGDAMAMNFLGARLEAAAMRLNHQTSDNASTIDVLSLSGIADAETSAGAAQAAAASALTLQREALHWYACAAHAGDASAALNQRRLAFTLGLGHPQR